MLKNSDYRNCLDEKNGNCVFMKLNTYSIPCCSIDGIIGVHYFGCVPDKTIKLKAKRETEVTNERP